MLNWEHYFTEVLAVALSIIGQYYIYTCLSLTAALQSIYASSKYAKQRTNPSRSSGVNNIKTNAQDAKSNAGNPSIPILCMPIENLWQVILCNQALFAQEKLALLGLS
jgi:hypothetical protein